MTKRNLVYLVTTAMYLILPPLSFAVGVPHGDIMEIAPHPIAPPHPVVYYYPAPIYYGGASPAVMTAVGENEYNQEQRAMADNLQLIETAPSSADKVATSGADSATAIGKLINSAKTSIDIEAFYINNQAGSAFDKQIIQNLIKQAQKGIAVRIIVDAKMYQTYPNDVDKLASIPNIQVVKTAAFNKQGGIVHAKLIIVDNEKFFIGSQNMDWIAFSLNHELGIIHGDSVLANQLEAVFNSDWQTGGGILSPTQLTVPTQPKTQGLIYVATSPNTPQIMNEIDNLTRMIGAAKTTLQIQAMDFSNVDPYAGGKEWTVLFDALNAAAERGVMVQVMVSNWEFSANNITANNKFLQKLAALSNVTVKYTNLPQSQPCVPFSSVDHAKYMVVDGKNVWIGTGNLDQGYFTQSRNYSVLVYDNSMLAKNVQQDFNSMWQSKYATAYTTAVTHVTDPSCTIGNSLIQNKLAESD